MKTDVQLERLAKDIFSNSIVKFRGIAHRDTITANFVKPLESECGIFGSKKSNQNYMHWTAWFKSYGNNFYLDSSGNDAPIELKQYLRINSRNLILLSTFQLQHFNEDNCGDWCIWFLKQMNEKQINNVSLKRNDFINIILSVINTLTF